MSDRDILPSEELLEAVEEIAAIQETLSREARSSIRAKDLHIKCSIMPDGSVRYMVWRIIEWLVFVREPSGSRDVKKYVKADWEDVVYETLSMCRELNPKWKEEPVSRKTPAGADWRGQTVTAGSSVAAFVSGRALAQWVVILLAVYMLVGVVAVISDIAEIRLLDRMVGGGFFTWREAEASDNRQATIGLIQTALFVTTAIVFLVWIYRARRNLPVLGARGLRYSPGWAVGWFFIPLANLVLPFLVATEIWKASDSSDMDGHSWRNAPSSPLIASWWALWVISALAGWAFRVLINDPEEITAISAATWAVFVGDLVAIPASLLLILVVREINARQEEKHG
jgi:hypothetical protein